jgi:hypothetical protein
LRRRKKLSAKKALTKKTALTIRSTLKSKKRLVANNALKPRSEKMKKLYERRRPFVQQFLLNNPLCQAQWDRNCQFKSADVHEIVPRGVGGAIVSDELENFMAVCRYCHRMITDNPEEAQRRGLRKWSWEK